MKTNIFLWIRNNLIQRVRFYAEQNKVSSFVAWSAIMHRGLFKVEIPFLEYSITTKCTLRCRDCSNLIPRIQPGITISKEKFKYQVDNLLQCVDYIYRFKLHGGEPFLNQDLPAMIEYLQDNNKIGEIRLSTNGTVKPSESLQKALQNDKVVVFLSDYPVSVSPKREEILKLLVSKNIKTRDLKGQTWSDLGDTEPRYYSLKQLHRLIRECSMANCKAMANGYIYLCSRCANGDISGLFEVPEKVFIDCNNTRKTRKELKRLYGISSCAGCERCSGVLKDGVLIAPAVQMED